jgi:hypothetical protein
MRRIATLLGLTVLLVTVAAGIAVAAVEVAAIEREKDCNNNPCYGTDENDLLHEREGSVQDRIYGLQGNDTIDANNFTNDGDLASGGKGRDTLWLNDGDAQDRARGGGGRDVCYVDPGDTSRSCIRRGDTDPASVAQ